MIEFKRRNGYPTGWSPVGFCLFLLLATLGSGWCAGQQVETELKLRGALQLARQTLHTELEALAVSCLDQQRPEQAAECRRWIIPRDPFRQYIFLPPSVTPVLADDAAEIEKSFHRRLNEIRGSYAARLFDFAKDYAGIGFGSQAYQLLHEVLVFDPDHQPARQVLGFSKDSQQQWALPRQRRTTARISRQKQAIMRWEKGTHWKIVSPHFEVFAAGGEADGLALATELEKTYLVWRQVFFNYWCSNERLKDWLAGTGSDGTNSRRYKIILFRDRDHYLADLADVPNVQLSSGYYNENQKASFFYSGPQPPVSTWRHETIHQLLQENARTGPGKSVAGKGHAWLVEGVALYFESMRVNEHHVTLGGFDALRLQYARLRCKREGFFVPMIELDAMDRDELQQHPDVAKLYSQASGISQFLFTANQGSYRRGFIDFIKEFYQGRRVKSSLAEKTLPLDQLDRHYAEFLNIDPKQLNEFFVNRTTTGLALGRGGLKTEDVRLLAGCTDLEWLELSDNPIGDAAVEDLLGMKKLTRLFLDETGITDASAHIFVQLDKLQELDLASTRFGDAGVARLVPLAELQVLWLASCKVTDDCLDSFAAMPKLQLVDLRQTRVTAAGIEKLKRARPSLQIMH